MKNFIIGMVCILVITYSAPIAFAADARDISFETSLARQLEELGLFKGVGVNADGTTDFDLLRKPSRLEAVIMLVRALGKGNEAESYPKSHPFTDVPDWADGYVSFACDNGLTKGVSDTLFGSGDTVTAEMYLTFMLRALGYVEGTYNDFTYDQPIALALWCGILPEQVDTVNFLRADAVCITSAALFSNIKGCRATLHERLTNDGFFTSEQFAATFSADPFLRMRLIDRVISEEFPSHEPLGLIDGYIYATESHIITDITESEGVLTVTAFVAYNQFSLISGNPLFHSGGGGWTDLWLLKLDAETLKLQSCRTGWQFMKEDGLALKDCFSEKSLEMRQALRLNLRQINTVQSNIKLESGEIKYKQPTYEESLAEASSLLSEVTQTLETDQCTVLLGKCDNKTYYMLYVIFKSGSSVGEGKATAESTDEETVMWLSEDCLTLYFSYHFENGAFHYALPPMAANSAPESGTATHTIDLTNMNTSFKITAD